MNLTAIQDRQTQFGNITAAHERYVKLLLQYANLVPNKHRVVAAGSSRVKVGDMAYERGYKFGQLLSPHNVSLVLPGQFGVAHGVYQGNQTLESQSNIWTVNLKFLNHPENSKLHRNLLADDEALRLDVLGVLGTQFVFFRPGLGTDLLLAWVMQLIQLMKQMGQNGASESLYFVSQPVRAGWIPKIILVGEHFDYIDEMVKVMLERNTISPGDEDIFIRVDNEKQAAGAVMEEQTRFDAFLKAKGLNSENDYDPNKLLQAYQELVEARGVVVEELYKLREVAGYRYTVSNFGSARPRKDVAKWNGAWENSFGYGQRLSSKGIGLMTGGGPGIMEAFLAGGDGNTSDLLAATLHLPLESPNKYILQNFSTIDLNLRLGIFGLFSDDYSCDRLGGFGTNLELKWIWKNIQRYLKARSLNNGSNRLYLAASSVAMGWTPKVVLIGNGMYEFVKTQLVSMLCPCILNDNYPGLQGNGTIDDADHEIIHFVKHHNQAADYFGSRKDLWETVLTAKCVDFKN